MSHRVEPDGRVLLDVLPFGLGRDKPKHYRDMLKVVWRNRDNLGYAWKVLSQGVCDGCALGVAGLHDWTIDGWHVCLTRLNLLRLNTMGELDHGALADVGPLKRMKNQQLREMGRLAYPMLRRHGEKGFTRIGWDSALGVIADRIRGSDPSRLAFFLTSRGITNEAYYTAQKVARFLGTNNIDNAARICHSPSTAALRYAIGCAATTCSYTDWIGSDLVVFFGSNPSNDQPVAMKYLDIAKRKGTKVALVNPLLEPGMKKYWVPSEKRSAVLGTSVADYWFGVRQGGDIAFLTGVIRVMIEKEWFDRAFVEGHTADFAALKEAALGASWERLEKDAGLPRASMEEFAGLIRDAGRAVLVWSMGITQHAFGGDNVSMIANLGLLKGYVGRDKCGLMPIRGHSGVQGGAEMGAFATALPGGKPINAENAAGLSRQYGFDVPDKPGLSAPEMVEAAHRGELDLLYCCGGNFVRTLPEPDYVAEAMSRVPLRVHADIILSDQLFIDPKPGGQVLLLPAATRYEQEGGGTQTSTERRVMFSPQIPRQVGECRSEWRIWLDIARAVDPKRAAGLGCDSGQAIRDEIARVVPVYDGIQRLRKTGDAFQYGGPHLCAGWKFPTPDGKARFRVVKLPDIDRPVGCFDLSTRRGKQFNTLIYAEVDPMTGAGRDAVLMNPDDAADRHLKQGDRVALANELGRLECTVRLAPIARGNLQVHWPEGNAIIRRGVLDAHGKVPDYNAVVKLEKVGG
jgi:molybdopterin-dependent oxidoreductase alpha subunit